MKSVREENSCAFDEYEESISTLEIPCYRVSNPLLESVPAYIGFRIKIGSKPHYVWINIEQFFAG